jgi:protein-tyrosine-phosphatase
MSSRRILFISPGDAARAQMAAGLLRHLAGGAVGVASASTAVATPPPAAVQAMAEEGIDLTGQPAQTLDQYAGQVFDEQILLCDGTTDT